MGPQLWLKTGGWQNISYIMHTYQIFKKYSKVVICLIVLGNKYSKNVQFIIRHESDQERLAQSNFHWLKIQDVQEFTQKKYMHISS